MSPLEPCVLPPSIKDRLQKATHETIFKLTLIIFFFAAQILYMQKPCEEFFSSRELARTLYERPASASQLPTCPRPQEPQPVRKDAAHRKCMEHRYKKLIASHLNSVLVSPYQLSLFLQDAFGYSKKGFLPPANLYSKGVDRTIRPTFATEAATLPAEMLSAKRHSGERSGFKKQNTLTGNKSPPSMHQGAFPLKFSNVQLSHRCHSRSSSEGRPSLACWWGH